MNLTHPKENWVYSSHTREHLAEILSHPMTGKCNKFAAPPSLCMGTRVHHVFISMCQSCDTKERHKTRGLKGNPTGVSKGRIEQTRGAAWNHLPDPNTSPGNGPRVPGITHYCTHLMPCSPPLPPTIPLSYHYQTRRAQPCPHVHLPQSPPPPIIPTAPSNAFHMCQSGQGNLHATRLRGGQEGGINMQQVSGPS